MITMILDNDHGFYTNDSDNSDNVKLHPIPMTDPCMVNDANKTGVH